MLFKHWNSSRRNTSNKKHVKKTFHCDFLQIFWSRCCRNVRKSKEIFPGWGTQTYVHITIWCLSKTKSVQGLDHTSVQRMVTESKGTFKSKSFLHLMSVFSRSEQTLIKWKSYIIFKCLCKLKKKSTFHSENFLSSQKFHRELPSWWIVIFNELKNFF